MSDERAKEKPAWSTTEPLPNPVAEGTGSSPDSSGAFDASGQPKKIAEVKRSAEVESMLEALSYPRPHAKAQKAVTDADMAAAHHAGPRALPAATVTAEPEAPIVLSHSLVEAIQAPPPQRPAVPAVAQGTTVVLRPRSVNRALVAAVAAGAALVVVWAFERTREVAPTHETVVAPPAAAPTIAPTATPTPPVVTTVTSAATAAVPSASAQSAQAPVLAASASARPHKGVPAPRASAGRPPPAPSAQEPSLRTDFQIEN